jgi:hypothetical protein
VVSRATVASVGTTAPASTTLSHSHSTTQPPSANPSRPASTLGNLLSVRRSNAASAAAATPTPEIPALPIKDQLALIAQNTHPCRIIQAHDAGVSSVHVILDPPSLLSCAADHVCHVWSLEGEPMGQLDPVTGLARGYELSTPGATSKLNESKKKAENEWHFRVDVAARSAQDRSSTHQVLMSLERMATDAAAHKEQQALIQETTAATSNLRITKEDKSTPTYPLTLTQVGNSKSTAGPSRK